jgi:pSer/pThr/pTyr-binding forkhead associated (FHA) protein
MERCSPTGGPVKKERYLDPVEIELGIRKAIEKSKQNFIGTNFVPHMYTVVVDDKAFDEYGDLLNTLGKMLGDSLDAWIMDKGYESDGSARVSFEKGNTQGKSFVVQIAYRAIDESAPVEGEKEPLQPQPDIKKEEGTLKEDLNGPVAGQFVNDATGQTFPVEEKNLLVGRGADCGIRIIEDTVSDNHARVRIEYGRITLEDLTSTNGTRVNLKRIKKAALSDGDRISFGSVNLIFRSGLTSQSLAPAISRPVAERTWRRRQPFLPRNGDK